MVEILRLRHSKLRAARMPKLAESCQNTNIGKNETLRTHLTILSSGVAWVSMHELPASGDKILQLPVQGAKIGWEMILT